MTDEEKVQLILEWACNVSEFDTDFVEQMNDRLQSGKSLTTGQSNALDNIIEEWGIDENEF